MSDLGDIIADALADRDELGMMDVVITRKTPGTRNPANPAAGTNPTSATYRGRGFIERTGTFHDGTVVKEDHVLISVFGSTITSSAGVEQGDVLTIAGRGYKVGRVMVDPVDALFECEAK